MFWFSYETFQNYRKPLSCHNKTIGIVDDCGVEVKKTSRKSRYKLFYFHLRGNQCVFGIYNYSHLVSTINVGDSVTVYHEACSSDYVNTDVVQVEKDSKIIVNSGYYKRTKLFLSVGTFIGAVIIIFIGLREWKKAGTVQRS